MTLYTIGQLARRAGIGVETIRFYERQGVLPTPTRLPSGYRQYPPSASDRIGFIRRAQRLGFRLKEVKELLALRDDPAARRQDVRERAAAKLVELDDRLHDLDAMRTDLARLIDECDGVGPATGSPILAGLENTAAGACWS